MFRFLLLVIALPICTFCKPIIIGISGGSGSGKTTLSEAIHNALKEDSVMIRQDSYYKDLSHLSKEERDHVNFDEPKALDLAILKEDLLKLKNNESIEIPIYDFATHSRKNETIALNPAGVIIVDGLFLLQDPEIRELLDIKVYVDVEHDVRLSRRIQRDLEERGRSLASVLDQYFTTVKPMHMKYIEPSKIHADLIVPCGGKNKAAQNLLVAKLKHITAGNPLLNE